MRVIAGQLGGRRLRAPRGRVTRPTSDRVKEAVFALLGDVQGASVLDLFAGSGGNGSMATRRSGSTGTMNDLEKSIAVCPGSYDPITNGHLDVIRRTAKLYDEVVVAVVNRSVRKSNALFGIDERMRFLENAIADLERVRAEPFSTLIVEFARRV